MNRKLIFNKLADNEQPKSLANKMRRKRFGLFQSLVDTLTVAKPLKILDAGGTQEFWSTMGMTEDKDVQIVLLNLMEDQVNYQNFRSMVGDVRDMGQFKDHAFDVVFSNSVIEHVGDFSDQHRMANEIRRVGKRYFIQTQNRHFHIEQH
jgi:ubiquinone/menaquinone biosynthesis C-methylase UbiE